MHPHISLRGLGCLSVGPSVSPSETLLSNLMKWCFWMKWTEEAGRKEQGLGGRSKKEQQGGRSGEEEGVVRRKEQVNGRPLIQSSQDKIRDDKLPTQLIYVFICVFQFVFRFLLVFICLWLKTQFGKKINKYPSIYKPDIWTQPISRFGKYLRNESWSH